MLKPNVGLCVSQANVILVLPPPSPAHLSPVQGNSNFAAMSPPKGSASLAFMQDLDTTFPETPIVWTLGLQHHMFCFTGAPVGLHGLLL